MSPRSSLIDFPVTAGVAHADHLAGGRPHRPLFVCVIRRGLDICMFSILTLYFRLTENTATPTSVVLMVMHSRAGGRGSWRDQVDA